MAIESNATPLDRCLEIYVPTECRCGKPLPEVVRAEALEAVRMERRTTRKDWSSLTKH